MARLKCPSLYFLQAKFLVERLSWFARDKGAQIDVTFEDRPQVKIDDLREYIFTTLKKPGRNTQIAYGSLAGLNARKVGQQVRLELADCYASAIGNGLNKDPFGGVETSYALSLLPKFWTRGAGPNSLDSYGLKITPSVDRAAFELLRAIDEARR